MRGRRAYTGVPRYHQTFRFEMKELGEIDMAPMALVAAIWPPGQRDLPRILVSRPGLELAPRDAAPELALRLRLGWRASQDAVCGTISADQR